MQASLAIKYHMENIDVRQSRIEGALLAVDVLHKALRMPNDTKIIDLFREKFENTVY